MDIQQPSAHSSEPVALTRAASQPDTREPFVQAARPWWRTVWAARVALVLILLIGFYFRTLSLYTWDSGTGQHPDERFFRNVASTVRLPASLGEYFDSSRSPLNPRNYEPVNFFVYGPFPITLTRLVAVTLTPDAALPATVPSILGPRTPQTNFGPEIPNPELNVPKLTLLHPLFNPEGKNLTTYGEIVNVGRSLAVLFDLGSLLLIFLIGRRLFGARAGLLAALLGSLAVMPIQQSHFFVDPIFSTFFALLAIYWAVRIAQGGGIGAYAAVGLSIGAAMSNRITLATLGLTAIVAALLATAAFVARWRAQDDAAELDALRRPSFFGHFFTRSLPLLCLAGLLTLLTFRALQPDAFTGSTPDSPPIPGEQPLPISLLAGRGFFDVRPDPRFLDNMRTVQLLVTGEIDAPPSHQWVNRPDYLFPWRNMVLWGMGPALGLTAWLGWALFGLRLADGRLWRRRLLPAAPIVLPAIILWVWVAFYFGWQGAQFAITLRYLLPIYGPLIIFAAWLLLGLWDWSQAHRRRGALALLRPAARWLPLIVVGLSFSWAYAFTRIYTEPHSRVQAARWLMDHAPPGSRITFEIWDDPLPLQVDGFNPWGQIYQGIETAPYAEDDPSKYFGSFNAQNQYQPGLLDKLEQADYITLTSNRVYDSATRLPMRFPALTRYYHYLFSGELGFELVADITSYPRLLGIRIPDQIAEEAFSVYDHPRVLIFRKTPAFSRERAEQLLTEGVNWGEVYKLPVRVADRAPTALRLTESQWPAYRAGGTWSESFDRQHWVNAAAPLVWLAVVYLLGLAAFALLFRLLPGLPDRGYSLARALAVLLVAYAAWLLGSLQLAPFTPATLWLCAAPLLALGAAVAWFTRAELRAFWQERRRALLTAETIFLGFFLLGLLLRWLNPDLWHPARGGEKPMDFAYLNAVLKSAAFPPYDPWHAGGYINYYYFGFVLVGALIHLTTIAPEIAYNLAVPTLFALTALGAWGVVYNLLAPRRLAAERAGATGERRARMAALLAPVFVLLLGNLAQAIWFLDGYAAQQGHRPEWAFWDATRIVSGTVNEFPFFTFLFADLHAHMIVMPFSLALLGLTVALVRMATHPARTGARWVLTLALMALMAGALRTTNTWDYPTYVGLAVATLALLAWRRWQQEGGGLAAAGPAAGGFAAAAATVVLGGNLLFQPFISAFATESSGVELLRNGQHASLLAQMVFADRTSLWDLLRINGLWLFLLTSAGIGLAWRSTRNWRLVAGLAGGVALVVGAGLAFGLTTPVLLIPLLIGAAALAWRLRATPVRLLLPLLWGGAALGLCLLVDLAVIKGDVGRMNTVFKFGLHAWTLFGLAAAVALPWMWAQFTSRVPQNRRALGWAWRGAAIALILAALVYPLTATPARIADRYAPDLPRTLDGLAFMRFVEGNENGRNFPLAEDAAAIAWLQQHVQGTPVILEAHQPSYRWAGRVATYTGLPTLLGWEWHQIQQRSAANADPVIRFRQNVISQIYNSPDPFDALDWLESYAVEYVYVGGVERALYDPAGLAKFEALAQQGYLELAFADGATTIYRVATPGAPTMLTTDLPVVTPQMRTPPPLMLDRPVNELPAVGDYAWNGWASANSWLAALVWLAALYGLALLGLPLAFLVFGRWRDGGMAWARLIGLLVLGYVIWLPTSLGIWHYNAWSLVAGVLLVLLLNAGLLTWLGRRAAPAPEQAPLLQGLRVMGAGLRERRRALLVGEGLFLAGFAAFTLIRAFNPDLWQPIWGGEKPMEFGFLNAILRSPVMPPYDPFFSGGYINYYYYGFYLASLPIRATGIAPAIAYNLVIPTLFALTLAGGYAIVAQLTGRVRYGLIGAAFLALLGNLAGLFAVGWSSGLPAVLNALNSGGLSDLGRRLDSWFVGPSRVIPFTINEFPFWAFLFADLHPHLIALPITLLAIALGYTLAVGRRAPAPDPFLSRFVYPLAALTLGALAVTNSWDFPTYALLIGAALVGAAWRARLAGAGARLLALGRAALLALLIGVGGLALYAPFFDRFYAFVSGVGLVEDFTVIRDYLVLYGVFLAVLLPVVLGAAWRVWAGRRVSTNRLILFGAALVLLSGAALLFPTWGLRLWLAALLLFGALLLVQRRIAAPAWYALLLAALAWSVSLGVETIFIRDHLAGGDWYRMNTVFKFGIQIWTLLALAAAAALPLLLRGLRRTGGPPAQAGGVALLALLAALAAVFPLAGTPSRLAYRFPEAPGPTLDGLAFLRQAEFDYDCQSGGCEPGVQRVRVDLRGDAEAIDWLNANIEGTPIVVQSNLWFYRAYGIRVAANTGLPTVISALHANEQRDPFVTGLRDRDVETLYRTSDPETALRLLAKYRVNYVYVGGVERAFYNEAGLRKFEAMRDSYLDVVYETPGVQIYAVRSIPAIYAAPQPYNFAAAPQPERPPLVERPAPPPVRSEAPAGLEELERAVAANPTDGPLVFGLAEQYRSLNRLDDAARVLRPAAQANPGDIGLHHLWGDILTQAGRYDEAEQAYLLAAQAAPTAGNWNKLGSALLDWGRLDKAEMALNQAIAIDPATPEPYYRLGQIYYQQRKGAQAVDALETYLQLAPDGQFHAEARRLLEELR